MKTDYKITGDKFMDGKIYASQSSFVFRLKGE